MKSKVCFFTGVVLLLVATTASQGQKPLTNDDVLQMVKAGFSEDTIIKTVETGEVAFDTSVQALIALKNAGVSEKIIAAMLSASRRKNEAKAAPEAKATPEAKAGGADPSRLPEDVGVYLKGAKGSGSEELVEVRPEVVTWRTGGILKAMATGGLTKGHVNGVVKNGRSPLQVSPPLEFMIRCSEGTSAAEYQLLRLDKHGDRREFRAVTGGILHASGGADRNAVAFDFEKVAPRTFRIKLADLKKGEYGFLPPGAMVSSSAASVGKMYTFGIE